jgi:hypothetical protein
MKTKKGFFTAFALLFIMVLFVVPIFAQGDPPPIGPDSGTTELVAYFNWLLVGLTAFATLIIGYIRKYIPGIKDIPNKFIGIFAAALVVGAFLFLALNNGKTIWEVISPLIGFITATGLIYPGVLKPLGLKSE